MENSTPLRVFRPLPLLIPRKGDSRCGSPLQTLPQSPLNIMANTDDEEDNPKSLSRQNEVKFFLPPVGRPQSRGSPAASPPPFVRRLFKEERAASRSPPHVKPAASPKALFLWARGRDIFSTEDAASEVRGMTRRRVDDIFAMLQTMGLIQGQPQAFEWTPAWKRGGHAAIEEKLVGVAGAYFSSGIPQMIRRFVDPFLCEDKTGFDPKNVVLVERFFPNATRRVIDMIDIFRHFGFVRCTGKGRYAWIHRPSFSEYPSLLLALIKRAASPSTDPGAICELEKMASETASDPIQTVRDKVRFIAKAHSLMGARVWRRAADITRAEIEKGDDAT